MFSKYYTPKTINKHFKYIKRDEFNKNTEGGCKM